MQATKTRGLAETHYGEQTKWRKTYGKLIPCHVISCIPGVRNQVYGAATGVTRSTGDRDLRLTEAGLRFLPAQRTNRVTSSTPVPVGIPQSAAWVNGKPPPTVCR